MTGKRPPLRRKHSVSCYRGRYHRTIEKAINSGGKVATKKFLLGTDKAAAELAARLLERLWSDIVDEHQRAQDEACGPMSHIPGVGPPMDDDRVTGVGSSRARDLSCGPIWRSETLRIAEAIRKGEREMTVISWTNRIQYYPHQLAGLKTDYSVIAFVPADQDKYGSDQSMMATQSRILERESRQLARVAEAPLPIRTGQTLHQAIDAYAKAAPQLNRKEFGRREAENAKRLKDSHPDVPLRDVGLGALDMMTAYWRSRPNGKKTGKPIAVSTVTNHLKTARRFIRWLHRSDEFKWSKPVDAEDSLRANEARLRTDDEIARLKDGVEVWTTEELAILYRHATDQDRLFMLLGLNCGFTQAEICSLRHDEISRRGDIVTIKRIRQKNVVYGELLLWPETVNAIEWFVRQRQRTPAAQDLMLVTEKGAGFSRQRISNAWNRLLDRVQRHDSSFRRLSFKYLRKTAGQFVRESSNGEIAGVFLCHGKPVPSDDLADAYTNRPFDKVSEALRDVRKQLDAIFDGMDDAFTKPRKRASRPGPQSTPKSAA